VIYQWRASPLHATRAAVASAWCVVVAGVALSFEHPLVLCALLAIVIVAAAGARVARRVLLALVFTLPFVVVIALINPLVMREGLTVIARLGTVPVLGQLDITAEATAYGGVLALRAMVVIGCFALHSAAVDPDDLLRAFRRVSFRSALTAALATRMVPVLARDARRLRDAQRCRAGEPAPRHAVVRAVASGALDRAVDVAATLEVRGYGAAGAARPARAPWSRHDLAFAAATVVILALSVIARIGGVADFDAYPSLSVPFGAVELVFAAALVLVAVAPFLDRRGIER
jgi:energy-coupling factor transport system permease protein